MSKHLFLLLCILLLGGLLRFIWIDKVPNSINGDQLHYILSAKSFVLTGKDLTQTVSPLDILLFHYPPFETIQAELPYFLDMLTVGIQPFSLTGIVLPSTILSFFLIIIMYLLTKKLTNEPTALIASFLTAINPWLFAMGRTSYEMVTATFFYLCAFYIMLATKGWKILLAFPLLVLAFYSYIATKLIFLPLIILWSIFCYFTIHKKQFLKFHLILITLSIIFVGFFLLQLHTSNQSRISEILTPSYPAIASQVDEMRKVTIPSPLLTPFENKISIFTGIILKNTFDTLSLNYLFLYGDYFFSLGKHGIMYLLDPLFLFVGAVVLWLTKRKLFWFLITLYVITILPQIVHSSSIENGNFSPHTTLLPPFLIIMIAVGIWQTIVFVKKKQTILGIGIIGSYIILLGNFINIYFFQLPLQHNFYNFPDRLLSQYISLAKSTEKSILIYTPDPRGKFQEYLFYTNTYNKDSVHLVTTALQNRKYKLGKVSFVSCDKGITTVNTKAIVVTHIECDMAIPGGMHSIPELSDSGAVYKISNDSVCSKYNLKSYITGSRFTLSDFNLDQMATSQFCETFITAR